MVASNTHKYAHTERKHKNKPEKIMVAIMKSRPVLLTVCIPLIYIGRRPLKKNLKQINKHRETISMRNTGTTPAPHFLITPDNDVCNTPPTHSTDQYIITLTISIIRVVLEMGIC